MNNIDPTSTWLTKKFMEDLLRNKTKDASLAVDMIVVSVGVTKGVNYASELQRVTVDYHDSATSHTRHFVVKSLPKSAVVRELVMECGTFERELRMYGETLPALRAILGESVGDFAPMLYPTCRPHTIVMADLSDAGFKMVDRKSEGLDYDHCKLVMLGLARWHAASIVHIKQCPCVVKEYKEKFYTPEFLPATTAIFQPMFTQLIHEVSTWPDFERYSAKLQRCLTIENIIALIKPQPCETIVLNHGDPWLNNTLFHYTDGHVDAVKLVDFQEVRVGSPALDLQYFFSTSPSVHVRETCWDRLLEDYHTEFHHILRLHGGRALEDMRTLDNLKRKIQEKGLFGLMAASTSLALIFLDGDDALDLDKVVKDDGSASEVTNMFLTPAFIVAFKKLLILHDKGIFKDM